MAVTRHKTFITYHHADEDEVQEFVDTFDTQREVFITRALGLEPDLHIIKSNNPEYVMDQIRGRFLKDSTVTIVMVGRCTWARRYVDWEIQSSLRTGVSDTPNGLFGILLPSGGDRPTVPERLSINLKGPDNSLGYARYYYYPTSYSDLQDWIEDAYEARTTSAHLIENPRERMGYNRQCL